MANDGCSRQSNDLRHTKRRSTLWADSGGGRVNKLTHRRSCCCQMVMERLGGVKRMCANKKEERAEWKQWGHEMTHSHALICSFMKLCCSTKEKCRITTSPCSYDLPYVHTHTHTVTLKAQRIFTDMSALLQDTLFHVDIQGFTENRYSNPAL